MGWEPIVDVILFNFAHLNLTVLILTLCNKTRLFSSKYPHRRNCSRIRNFFLVTCLSPTDKKRNNLPQYFVDKITMLLRKIYFKKHPNCMKLSGTKNFYSFSYYKLQ